METIDQKKRRLYGKTELAVYLNELNKIVQTPVHISDLLSIVETDKIRQCILLKEMKISFKINFDNKIGLKDIVFNNLERTEGKYYMFTSYSNNCGVFILNNLKDFNFNFSFEDLPSGLVTLVRTDFLEEIVLDFSEEQGIKYLEIEIYKTQKSSI